MEVEMSPERENQKPNDPVATQAATEVSNGPDTSKRPVFIGSSDMSEAQFFGQSILTQGRTHESVIGVPYCEVCKKYLEGALKIRNHTLKGFAERRFPGWFQRKIGKWFLISEGHLMEYNTDSVR